MVIRVEIVPRGTTKNKNACCISLRRLHEAIWWKGSGVALWDMSLQHDSATAYRPRRNLELLQWCRWELIDTSRHRSDVDSRCIYFSLRSNSYVADSAVMETSGKNLPKKLSLSMEQTMVAKIFLDVVEFTFARQSAHRCQWACQNMDNSRHI
jgi:hypothetical protein